MRASGTLYTPHLTDCYNTAPKRRHFYTIFTHCGGYFIDFFTRERRYYTGDFKVGEEMLDVEMIGLVLVLMGFMLALLHYLSHL